jgi:hypothetical protein
MKSLLSIILFASATLSGSAAVVTKWTAQLDRSAYDQAVGLGTDAAGNLYLAANSADMNQFGPTAPLGWFVAKYTAAGSNVWVVSSATDSDMVLRGVTVNPAGQVSVTGSIYGEGTEQLYAARIETTGELIWEYRHADATALSLSAGNAIVTDAQGIAWAAGTVYTNDIGFFYPIAGLLVQLDATGHATKQVVNSLPGVIESGGFASLALDRAGALLLRQPGYPTNVGWAAFVVKYSPAGERLWQQRTDIIDLSAFGKYPLAGPLPDADGNLFLTGPVLQSDFQIKVMKFSSSGTALWHALYAPRHGGGADSTDLAVDPEGNVVITGNADTAYIYDDFFVRDIVTVKYGNDGKFRWLSRGIAPASPILGQQIAFDGRGNTYVAGEGSTPADAPARYLLAQTMKFNRLGQREWLASQPAGPGPGKIAGLIVSSRGEVVVGGSDEVNTGRPVDAYLTAYRQKSELASPRLLGPVKVQRRGSDVILSVKATGRGPLRYEWFRDELPVAPGSSSSLPTGTPTGAIPVMPRTGPPGRSLTIVDAAAHAGEYCVAVSNERGTVVSEIVRVELPSLDAVIEGIVEPSAATRPSGAFKASR